MQKLFSMFPSGPPGVALLLLRLFGGAVLLSDAAAAASTVDVMLAATCSVCALAILVGSMTPIAAVVAALIEATGLYFHIAPIELDSFGPVVIALALALLGPGAYSLDAKVFGRRLMHFGPGVNDDGRDEGR